MTKSHISQKQTNTLDDYKNYLKRINKSPSSKTYFSVLTGFKSWLNDTYGKSFDNFTSNDALEYKNTQNSADSENMFMAALKGYCNYRIGSYDSDDPRINKEFHRLTQLKQIPRRRKTKTFKKVALNPDELKQLLRQIRKDNANIENPFDDLLYVGTIIQFYFGARPIELAYHIKDARINWEKCEMIIHTAKIGDERYLAWHPKLTPYMKVWCENAPYPSPSEWLTKKIRKYNIDGMRITAKTARKTVETQMRISDINDFLTDKILGHVSKTSAIGDVYTDFTQVAPLLKDVFINKHYMIVNNII